MTEPHPITTALRETACMVRQFEDLDSDNIAEDLKDFLSGQANIFYLVVSSMARNAQDQTVDSTYMREFIVSKYLNDILNNPDELSIAGVAATLEEQAAEFQRIFDEKGPEYTDLLQQTMDEVIAPVAVDFAPLLDQEVERRIQNFQNSNLDEETAIHLAEGFRQQFNDNNLIERIESNLIENNSFDVLEQALDRYDPIEMRQILLDLSEISSGFHVGRDYDGANNLRTQFQEAAQSFSNVAPEISDHAKQVIRGLDALMGSSPLVPSALPKALILSTYDFKHSVDALGGDKVSPERLEVFKTLSTEMTSWLEKQEDAGEKARPNQSVPKISYKPIGECGQ